jgi:hypothetical protein
LSAAAAKGAAVIRTTAPSAESVAAPVIFMWSPL